jgi:hypothetical protein
MSRTSWALTGKPASHTKYRYIFDNALKVYEEKTGKNLASNPLLRRLKTCDSPDDILVILRQQIPRICPSGSGDDGLTRWLNPTVNVIHSFSEATGRAVGQVSQSRRVRDDTPRICMLIFYSAGISTRRADLYGHSHPPLSNYFYYCRIRAVVTP